MDSLSLMQIIERIPELQYKYLGCFPADCVPELPPDTFAVLNNKASSSKGEHWLMIARKAEKYYFADSLGRKQRQYPFLKRKYKQMIPDKLQEMDNMCGFYTIYAAYQLFKFNQENLIGLVDVDILLFISNFM